MFCTLDRVYDARSYAFGRSGTFHGCHGWHSRDDGPALRRRSTDWGLGDFLVPEKVLGDALLVEGAGVLAFLFAETPFLAYLSTTLLALGFGAGYISFAVVLARFLGPVFLPRCSGSIT